jgi:pentatricopeptide repeat protein
MNAVISSCAHGGQWKKALSLLESMPRLGLKPDVITINAAGNACEKGGQWEKVIELLDSMQDRGLEPNAVTMRVAVEALHANAQYDRAMAVVDDFTSLGVLANVWLSKTKIDLHECSAAVAQAVMSCLLRDLSAGKREVCNILVITGRGNRSNGEATLPKKVRSYFTSAVGPAISEVPGNPGCFQLKKRDISNWIMSS